MSIVSAPAFELAFNHKDVTDWIQSMATSVVFQDHLEGESDGLEVELHDRHGLWRGDWYPVKGDTLELRYGFSGKAMASAGSFDLDELEFTGPPDIVKIKGVAAGTKKALRTNTSRAFESISLAGIVGRIASEHGLTVVGVVPPASYQRVTQNRETDLAFLARLALDEGAAFNVRGGKLIFHSFEVLDAQPHVAVIKRTQVTDYTFRDKVHKAEHLANHADLDPVERLLYEATATAAKTFSSDTHRVRRRTESKGHTERLAKKALHRQKGWEAEGTLKFFGNPMIVAGCNVVLDRWDKMNGLWQVKASRHQLVRSVGYTTEVDIRRIA